MTEIKTPEQEAIQTQVVDFTAVEQLLKPWQAKRMEAGNDAQIKFSCEDGLIIITAIEINIDSVTGLPHATEAFKMGNLALIKELFLEKKMKMTFVDVDLRNLKGLNDLLTHDGANVAIRFYSDTVLNRAKKRIEAKGGLLVPYRPQAGGDEFKLIFFGDVDPEELKEIFADVPYSATLPGADQETQLTIGGEFAAEAIQVGEHFDERVAELEKNIDLIDEDKKVFAELSTWEDKINYVLKILQANTEISVVKYKEFQLIDELEKGERLAQESFVNEATSVEEIKIDIQGRLELMRKALSKFLGSRRLGEIGQIFLAGLITRYSEVAFKLKYNIPLENNDLFLLKMVTSEQHDMERSLEIAQLPGVPIVRRVLAGTDIT